MTPKSGEIVLGGVFTAVEIEVNNLNGMPVFRKKGSQCGETHREIEIVSP
jgi:hypothetical protein